MGFRPWLSHIQTDYYLIVWWSSLWIWLKKRPKATVTWSVGPFVCLEPLKSRSSGDGKIKVSRPTCSFHKNILDRPKIRARPNIWHGFTKLAVSRLILVRFSKFKICHAQHFGADLSDVIMTSRATRRARWRHARAWVTSHLTPSKQLPLSLETVISW